MRSIRLKILIWSVSMLVLSLLAFVWISHSIVGTVLVDTFERMEAYKLQQARTAYERGGPPELANHLDEMHRVLGGDTYLTDSTGRDLANGRDRSGLVGDPSAKSWAPRRLGDKDIFVTASADGRYRLISVHPTLPMATFVGFYLLLLAVVVGLFWLLTVDIASPLRELAKAVERFGRGDRTVRVGSSRKDEIGELGRSFDEMAGRIETLLTAEHQLLQDVSHELRSPLVRLTFAAELVRKTQDRDVAVARLRTEIDRLSELVSTLLEMTSAEGDPAACKREDVCLSDLLHEVSDACQVEVEAGECRIEIDTLEQVRMPGDGELLRRAFENVLRNAIRCAPRGSAVQVKMVADRTGFTISVRDYGPGVPDELLPRIFSPFFRVDPSRDENTGGVGLGLAIARRAVHIHHGEVRAVNAAPGLLVTIILPVPQKDGQPLSATARNARIQ